MESAASRTELRSQLEGSIVFVASVHLCICASVLFHLCPQADADRPWGAGTALPWARWKGSGLSVLGKEQGT